MGRENGVCKGKGGSMHLADPKSGVMGASAVVGSTISHAIGYSFMDKMRLRNSVTVVNFGDGATEQGSWHECLNMAALYQVPVIFFCEDNGLAVHARRSERQSYSIASLVSAYDIRFIDCEDGYCPTSVSQKCADAVDYSRKNCKPVFVKVKTCRYKEHVGPGEDFHYGYRSKAEVLPWVERDPVDKFKKDNPELVRKINNEIEEAVNFSLNSSLSNPDELLTDI